MESSSKATQNQDAIGLGDLIVVLWRRRLTIASITVVCGIVAATVAWSLPKKYEASVVVSATSNSAGGNQLGALSSLASQFGGLASLAGLSMTGDSRKSESLAVLQSEALTEQYIQKNNLLPVLFRDKWDTRKKEWLTKESTEIPTLWAANEYFKKKIRAVTIDAKSGLVTLTINWTNPRAAATWANELVSMTNDYMRTKAIQESDRNIDYLNQQASKTDAVGIRQVIYALLQTEISKGMLARGNDEYALKVIDPAVAPERESSPKILRWVSGGLIGGLIASIALVISLSRQFADSFVARE